MIILKIKNYIFLSICLLLTSCTNKIDKKPYEIIDYTNVYAYSINNQDYEIVEIEYEINDPIDVFLLYSIDQNNLPAGYTSKCYSNVNVIDCKIINDDVYYIVDNKILNVQDIDIFNQLLSLGVQKIGYKNAYLMYNDTLLTKNDIK